MLLDFTIDMASRFIKKKKGKVYIKKRTTTRRRRIKNKNKKQSIFSITEDLIEKYWKCELKSSAI